jgi:hypothetical protein
MQTGEVLDLDFFQANPFGDTTKAPDALASGIFLRFDLIGSSEDMVIVLKLVDADDGTTRTTRALIVDNADIFKGPTPTSMVQGYDLGTALDNNDGVVFIESNDYNVNMGDNWLIEGVQVLGSTEGITGSGINLVGATGDAGGSTATLRAFDTSAAAPNSTTESTSEPIKISDIGFVLAQAGNQNANLEFEFKVKDGDGDESALQTLQVSIVSDKSYVGTALADVFDINLITDSPAGDGRATIAGFQTGTDLIDLSDIDAVTGGSDDAFSYIEGDPFGNMAGELRFDVANHWLEADLDGDGVADMQIELTGINTPPPDGDLIL